MALLRLRAMVDSMRGRFGLARHVTKAHPERAQRLQHLMRPEIDLAEMRFYAPPDKLRRVAALARDLLCRTAPRRRRLVPARLLAALAGKGQFFTLLSRRRVSSSGRRTTS
eukprot:jgi/Tetstr1/439934/TSEL_028341.t1